MYFGMKFELSAILSTSIMYIVTSIEADGDLTATVTGAGPGARGCGDQRRHYRKRHRQHHRVLLRRTADSYLQPECRDRLDDEGRQPQRPGLAGVFILIAGLSPGVLGDSDHNPGQRHRRRDGLRIRDDRDDRHASDRQGGSSPRNLTIAGLSVALGIGILQVDGSLTFLPDWAMTIFGESSVVIASVFAIVLNLIILKDDKGTGGRRRLRRNNGGGSGESCGRSRV